MNRFAELVSTAWVSKVSRFHSVTPDRVLAARNLPSGEKANGGIAPNIVVRSVQLAVSQSRAPSRRVVASRDPPLDNAIGPPLSPSSTVSVHVLVSKT